MKHGNDVYWDNLTRTYGAYGAVEDKSKRFKSDFTFEELTIGMQVLYAESNTVSDITNLTSNSIETYNRTNQKNRYKTGAVDSSGEVQSGKLKGINGKNWYTLEEFNRTFKRVK
jgi:alpha-ketoglutarate-dependent taurine dioxygenase